MNALALVLLLAVPVRAELPPEILHARVVSWDLGFHPKTQQAWIDRLASEVSAAARDRVDVLVLPELLAWGLAPYKTSKAEPAAVYITRVWKQDVLPRFAKALMGKDILMVAGSYPHQEAGWKHAFNRAAIWTGSDWLFADKLHPTQAEMVEDPPIRAGERLPLLRFKGATVAALICFSVEMPEVSARLKAEGVQLVLVPSATPDEHGVGRILRSASARAVELGAAVLVSPLTGEQDGWKNMGSASLFLPDQEGFSVPAQVGPRRSEGIYLQDFELPCKRLLGLRAQTQKPETRPFLAVSPAFTIAR